MANVCMILLGEMPRVTARYQNLSPEDCANTAITGGPGYVLLSPTEFIQLRDMHDATMVPFDYAMAGAVFSFFFTFTLGCWVVARNIGVILAAVRRW